MSHRPIERCVLRLAAEGHDDAEIARRFKRSPEMIGRLMVFADLPRSPRPLDTTAPALRPLERRVLRWRESGADHAEIAARFHRNADHIARVERFARGKLAGWATPDTTP
jgi:DNA-binding CsgD family transcriptional regulator